MIPSKIPEYVFPGLPLPVGFMYDCIFARELFLKGDRLGGAAIKHGLAG